MRISAITKFASLVLLWFPGNIFAQSFIQNSGLLLLPKVSPRVNAMGECGINYVDERSALHNPGSMGLFHLSHTIAFTPPHSANWLPELADDLILKGASISAGYSHDFLSDNSRRPFRTALAIAYSKHRFDYGEFLITDQTGNLLETLEPYELSNSYSVAVALEYYLRIGVGYTRSKLVTELLNLTAPSSLSLVKGKGQVHMFGIIAEAPIHTFFKPRTKRENSDPGMNFEITPSFAYTRDISVDSLDYQSVGQKIPLPRIAKTGIALTAAVVQGDAIIVSGTIVRERETQLETEASLSDGVNKRGYELNALGIFSFRTGSFKDDPPNRSVSTRGFGVNLQGILKWLSKLEILEPQHGITNFLFSKVNVTYDWAEYEGANGALRGTKFIGFSFSL